MTVELLGVSGRLRERTREVAPAVDLAAQGQVQLAREVARFRQQLPQPFTERQWFAARYADRSPVTDRDETASDRTSAAVAGLFAEVGGRHPLRSLTSANRAKN